MRPVTIFVLLLFASGFAGGDLCARTLAAQRFTQLPVLDRARVPVRHMAVPVAVPSDAGPGRAPRSVAPRRHHRRPPGRGILPAPRAPDLRPEIT